MTFANPGLLWLGAMALPVLVALLWLAWRKKQSLIRQFVQSRLLAQLTVGVSPRRQKLRLSLVVAVTVLIFLALARPQYGFIWQEVRQRGLDIIVAVDTSRSMLATDVPPNRLTRAKLAALDLVQLARTDRLGLVAFAGTAFLQCPITLDDEAFRQSVDVLDVNIIPQGGTALGEAIDVAVKAFQKDEENFRVLILFTDGEDHEGGALEAAERAAKARVRIYTVGVGTAAGEQVRMVDEQGRTSYLKDDNERVVVSKLNETLLRGIARATGGEYLALQGPRPMDLLYAARLAPLPKSDLSSRLFQLRHEWFQWPLGLAILLLMIELLAPDRVRVARQPEGAQRKGLQAPTAALGFFLALVLPVPVAGSAASARRHYEAGRFEAARRDYQRLLEAAPDDARLQYNTGTAAHRAQRFAEATNALQSALLSSDPQLLQRAYYNLGNSFYRLGEKTEDLNARLQHWEQALEHYNSALKLSQRDADTRFNRDLVAKKLEELKKQMPPPQSKQDQQSKEDKGDQQKQKDQDQQKSSAEKEQKKEPESSEEKKQQPDQGKEDSSQQQPQEQQQQEQGDKEQSHKQDKKQDESQPTGAEEKQPQSSPEQGRPPDQTDASQAAATALGQMTPEQARRLLDTVKAEERPMIFRPAKESRAGARSYRNW